MTSGNVASRWARMTGILLGISVSLATVVMLPIALVYGAWWGFYDLVDGRLPDVALAGPLSVFENTPLFAWRGWPIPYPPDNRWVLGVTKTMLWPGFLLIICLHLCIPMSFRIRQAAGFKPHRMTKDHELQAFADRLQTLSKGPRVNVWVIPTSGIQAFALSGPFWGHAIVFHQGLLNQIPKDQIKWVLCHEYGHILHGDTRSSTLWVLAMQSIQVFDRFRHFFARIVLRAVIEMPLLRLLTTPLSLLFMWLSWIGRLGKNVGGWIFKLFDAWASRRMEYAADDYAAHMMGATPGIVFFESIMGDWEPRFNGIFATHPRLSERAKALKKQLAAR